MRAIRERLLTNRTVTITEFREPAKVFDKASGKPVAILRSNKRIGYLVPADTVHETEQRPVERSQLDAVLTSSAKKVQPVLDFQKRQIAYARALRG